MKAITLTQPWAWSIVHAGKRIENRMRSDGGMPSICGQARKHVGRPLLLHAAKGMKIHDYEGAVDFMVGRRLARTKHGEGSLPIIPPRLQGVGDDMLPRGCVVGRCKLVGYIERMAGETTPRIVIGDALTSGNAGCHSTSSSRSINAPDDAGYELARQLDLRWWMGGNALVLDDVKATDWIPCRGMLGLWKPPAEVLERISA